MGLRASTPHGGSGAMSPLGLRGNDPCGGLEATPTTRLRGNTLGAFPVTKQGKVKEQSRYCQAHIKAFETRQTFLMHTILSLKGEIRYECICL